MPPLKQMLRSESPEGFAAVEETQSPTLSEPKRTVGANPFIRTTLPPFNAGSDTLRQFDENGKTPTRRVIPLPISTTAGGNSTTTTNTTIIQQGSSGSSTTTATLVVASVNISTPSLVPGATYTSQVTMAKVFKLLSVTSSQPVELRLYSTALAQSGDLSRITDAPIPFQIVPGVITDVVFDTAPYKWAWADRGGTNGDSPMTPTVYVTVVNPSQTTGLLPAVISVTYLIMES